MQPILTPFTQIQRRDKQRKITILNNIQKKDLRRRSISYNFKATDNTYIQSSDIDDKSKQQFSQIAINNSIKKSYYFRKLMNKSIEAHLTSQEFQRVKQKLQRLKRLDNQNKSTFFRELWEQELVKKQNLFDKNQQQSYLEIVSKNPQKIKLAYLEQYSLKKKEDDKLSSIFDIAKQRQTALNFDLQILGNKKSIRIKNNKFKNKNSLTTTTNRQQNISQKQTKKQLNINNHQQQQIQQNASNKVCSFFKRFQEQNHLIQPRNHNINNQFLQIKKFNQTLFPFNTINFDQNTLKKLKLRSFQSANQNDQKMVIPRQIQSSWKPSSRLSQERQKKIETSHFHRGQMRKQKNSRLPFFNNDIKGWGNGQQNDEQFLTTFEN